MSQCQSPGRSCPVKSSVSHPSKILIDSHPAPAPRCFQSLHCAQVSLSFGSLAGTGEHVDARGDPVKIHSLGSQGYDPLRAVKSRTPKVCQSDGGRQKTTLGKGDTQRSSSSRMFLPVPGFSASPAPSSDLKDQNPEPGVAIYMIYMELARRSQGRAESAQGMCG